MEVTQADLTEALTSFRLAVKTNGGAYSFEVADPETVASVLHATLSRIAAEREPDADPGDLTATLAEVRMQADDHHLVPARMVYPLLGAVEAVLKEHHKMTLYALSVYAHDNSDEPRVHCGHAYANTKNSRHVLDDDDNVICLDKPEADVCESCRDESGEQLDWPCPTVEAIARELTKGKGGTGD